MSVRIKRNPVPRKTAKSPIYKSVDYGCEDTTTLGSSERTLREFRTQAIPRQKKILAPVRSRISVVEPDDDQQTLYAPPQPLRTYPKKGRVLRSTENHWVSYYLMKKRLSTLSQYDSNVRIVIGNPEGQQNYFRAFAGHIPVPVKKEDKTNRIQQLLPYRMRKTIRLYGVSPLVLLGTVKPKIQEMRIQFQGTKDTKKHSTLGQSPRSTTEKRNLLPKKAQKAIIPGQIKKSNEEVNMARKRVVGPEIEPHQAEDFEFDINQGNVESPSVNEKMSYLPMVDANTLEYESPELNLTEPSIEILKQTGEESKELSKNTSSPEDSQETEIATLSSAQQTRIPSPSENPTSGEDVEFEEIIGESFQENTLNVLPIPENVDIAPSSNRIAGPEIEPNMAEANEFKEDPI
jgi:hypothetical protein